MTFQRAIGPGALLLTAIGGIIGSGWLFGPYYAAHIAGPAAILSWAIGGLLMMIIALTFAELGSSFPMAGGMVRFAQMSHGPVLGAVTGWMVWLSSVAVAPVETMALLQYAATYVPQLMRLQDGAHVLTWIGIIIAAFLMLIMCFLNWYGVKLFSRASSGIVIIKIIVPIVTAIILLYYAFEPKNFHAYGGFVSQGWQSVFAALPLGGIVFSFIGYSPTIQLAAEAKNPQRAIPFAILGALIFCIILYVGLQIAFIGAIPSESLLQGWSNLHYVGDTGPFAGILLSLGLISLVTIIYADALISPFGTALIYTASTARVPYGLAQNGFFPKIFTRLSHHGVPFWGIILNYLVGMLLFMPFPSWQKMVSFIVSCFVISYIIGPLALVGLRQSLPHYARPFKLPFANLFCLLAFYICNLFIYWAGWQVVWRLMIALFLGLILFIISSYKQGHPVSWENWRKSTWLFLYLFGVCVISYVGSFGGKSYLSFGFDFVIIACFSLTIFYLAIRSFRQIAPAEIEAMAIMK